MSRPKLPLDTRSRLLRTATALVFVSLLLLVPRTASAGNQLAVDADLAYPGDKAGLERGWGGGVRFGKNWDLWLIELTPELGGTYHAFGGALSATSYRGVLGARLGLGLIIQPNVFVHAGYGHVGYSGIPATSGLTYDAGLGLDFTLIPKIDLGAHAALMRVNGSDEADSLSWAVLGAHLEIKFDD